MGERDTTVITGGPVEEPFDPALGELDNDDFKAVDFTKAATEQPLKAKKRRQAEERLELLRLREELGDYGLDFGEEI